MLVAHVLKYSELESVKEVVTLKKRRTFCADSPYGKENCPYAKVVEEQGSFTGRMQIMYPDGRKVTCDYEEKSRYAVYCTHPKSKQIFVGTVEPYGITCEVP